MSGTIRKPFKEIIPNLKGSLKHLFLQVLDVKFCERSIFDLILFTFSVIVFQSKNYV